MKSIRLLPSLLVVFISFFLPACEKNPNQISEQFIVFGTEVSVTLYDTPKDKANHAIQQIESRFYQFHQDWHAWEKGGIMGKINQAIHEHTSIHIPADVSAFIQKSQQLAKQSNYLFDPGIGKLIALWGFHSDTWQGPPPTPMQIHHWLQTRPSIRDIQIKENRLSCRNPDVSLDFGGNAKGLALDIAIQTLRQAGIQNAVVNIGGDLRIIGSKNGVPWRIGIQDPQHSQKALAYLELQDNESLVTSGNYQRYFEWQGQTFSHILNPNTGYPADHFSSVTVLHTDATTADAAATALMIAGEKDWQAIAQQMGIDYALMIDSKGKQFMTKKMAKRLKML